MSSDYEKYVRAEWEMFVGDTQRGRVSLEAAAGLQVMRVLDVGCGAGQELLPFAPSAAICVGVDLSPEAGQTGRELFGGLGFDTKVAFARATAEALPFRSYSFDLVICRLALPYTNNARALAEMARVLEPDGVLLLKIHHARFYLRKFRSGLLTHDVLSTVHAGRVLAAGLVYHLTGRQVRNRFLSSETFQTEWLLRRELGRCGLEIRQKMPSSNPSTPFFLIGKCGSQ
jgi:ubiquinone/menaquinone biosynthesis C-methylase UbiE